MASQSDQSPSIIMQMACGLWLSRALWLAARFRIADAIGDERASSDQIAAKTGTNADALRRLLMALSAMGIFQRHDDDRFGLTPLSQCLKSDHPATQRALIEAIFGAEHFTAWGAVEESLLSGKSGFEAHYGEPPFDYYARHPEAAKLFGEAMTATTRMVEEAVLSAHDFGSFKLGVDIGGSEGSLLRRLLATRPDARGIIFDLPETAEAGRHKWKDTPEASRLTAAGGDFFKAVPEGDFYLLKFILHDWPDDRCARILSNIRKAIVPGGRIAIVEMVLPDEPVMHPGWMMDLNMLAITGGRERSTAQYNALLQAAGFEMKGVTPTASGMSVVTAYPV